MGGGRRKEMWARKKEREEKGKEEELTFLRVKDEDSNSNSWSKFFI